MKAKYTEAWRSSRGHEKRDVPLKDQASHNLGGYVFCVNKGGASRILKVSDLRGDCSEVERGVAEVDVLGSQSARSSGQA